MNNFKENVNMPIPMPKKGEKESDFIGRCVSQMKHEDPDMPSKQCVAICYDTWRKVKGETMADEKKYDEEGNIIIAENVKVVFGGDISPLIKEEVENEQQ